jgi:hypothetical protein
MELIKSSYLILNPHKRAINWFGVDENKIFKTSPLEFS